MLELRVSLYSYNYVLQTYSVKASSQPSTALKPISSKGLPSRADMLQKLREGKQYDVLVIGGGATGCGVALDSVTRGNKPLTVPLLYRSALRRSVHSFGRIG